MSGIIFVLVLSLIVLCSCSVDGLIKKGDEAMKEADYKLAMRYYEKALEKGSDDEVSARISLLEFEYRFKTRMMMMHLRDIVDNYLIYSDNLIGLYEKKLRNINSPVYSASDDKEEFINKALEAFYSDSYVKKLLGKFKEEDENLNVQIAMFPEPPERLEEIYTAFKMVCDKKTELVKEILEVEYEIEGFKARYEVLTEELNRADEELMALIGK